MTYSKRDRGDYSRYEQGGHPERRRSQSSSRSGASRYSRDSKRYSSSAKSASTYREFRNVPQQTRTSASSPNRYGRDQYVSHEPGRKAQSVSRRSYNTVRRRKPINPRTILILGVIALLLCVIVIARLVAFGGVLGEYHAVRDSIDQEKTQLMELESSSNEMQTEMDSMQETIDIYNKAKK